MEGDPTAVASNAHLTTYPLSEREIAMKHLMTGTALVAVLAIAAPAWAQTSEDLNRQELNRLTMTTPAPAPVQPAPVAAVPQPYAAPAYPYYPYPYPDYAYSYPYAYYGDPFYPVGVSLGWGWGGGWRGGWGGGWHGGWGGGWHGGGGWHHH